MALLASCMAYGRVDLFAPWVDWILARMGDSPARFVLGFDPAKPVARFEGFRYRFNRPRDVAAFAAGYSSGDEDVGPALERFVDQFLTQDLSAVFPRNRLSYGYRHWFPRPSTGGACKRMLLFLRWMVRREAPDFGLWRAVPPAALLIPVDTHIENMARALGLTRRRSRNWKMTEEITRGLRRLDPTDPVKYDFSLCHTRMSGQCLDRRDAAVCGPCRLRSVCRHWRGRRGGRA